MPLTTQNYGGHTQFSVSELLQYVTLCAVLCALSGVIGMGSSVSLMLMSLALWFRHGLLALGMLMAASLASDWPHASPLAAPAMASQLLVILSAAAICGWYGLHRSVLSRAARFSRT